MLQFIALAWVVVIQSLVDRYKEASNSGEAGLSGWFVSVGMDAFIPFSESIYAFIPWLCGVKRHPWWHTSSLFSALLASGLHMHPFMIDASCSRGSCRSSGSQFPWVAKVQNNVKCFRSVEKTYINLTASNFSWRNTCTKDGSFSRRKIESASKIDPGADRIC